MSQFEDKTCYISSFCVSQKDMFESIKRVTGTTDNDWKISHEEHVERFERAKALLASGERRAVGMMMYTRIMYPDGDGDSEAKSSNKLLGLPQEDLDEFTKLGVEAGKSGKKY